MDKQTLPTFEQIRPADIHKGNVIWESGQYGSVEFRVIDEPTHIDGQWKFQGQARTEVIDFLVTDGYEHYGPRFYHMPMYMHNIEPLDSAPQSDTKDVA